MRKLISFAMVAVVMVTSILSTNMTAQAEGVTLLSEEEKVQETVQQFERDFPEAKIAVIDGRVHVLVSESNVPQTRTTVAYNAAGGSFVDFQVASYEVYRPQAQVYMTKDVVDATLLKMSRPDIFQSILGCIAENIATDVIVYLVAVNFGITIPPGVVTAIGFILTEVLPNIDYWSLEAAKNQSSEGKAYVVYGYYSNGTPFTIYGPWSGTRCSTFMNFNATWRANNYQI